MKKKERERVMKEKRHLNGSTERIKNKFGPTIPGPHVVKKEAEMELSEIESPRRCVLSM